MFVCLVASICLGAPAAATWVAQFGNLKPELPMSFNSSDENEEKLALVKEAKELIKI